LTAFKGSGQRGWSDSRLSVPSPLTAVNFVVTGQTKLTALPRHIVFMPNPLSSAKLQIYKCKKVNFESFTRSTPVLAINVLVTFLRSYLF
jgi:hypothetical protein